jgi:hypothetical protein
MGFIKDNTNTFEVYLTDLGKEVFFKGGFKDSVVYFSMCDGDSNYQIFMPDKYRVAPFNSGTLYYNGDVVSYGTSPVKYYRYKQASSLGTNYAPTMATYWEEIDLFDPRSIETQAIPTINHNNTKLTSLGNGTMGNTDDYINDVFVQVPLRGKVADNIEYRRALLGTRQNTQKEYIMREPDFNSTQTLNLLTYTNI